jgi:hypothetical protein
VEGGWQCCTRQVSSRWVSSPASSGFLRHRLAATENAAIQPANDLPSGIYPVTTKNVPLGRCADSPPKSTLMPVEDNPYTVDGRILSSLGSLVER